MTTSEVISLANIVTPIVVGVVGWLVRQSMSRITDRIEALETKSKSVEGDVKRYSDLSHREVDELRKATVSREDWIRESRRTQLTLERLIEGQARLEGATGIGSQIVRAIRNLNEGNGGGQDGA